MSAIEHEVASQPEVWLEASRLAGDAPLPAHGARLAVIGCGTSLYVAQAYAAAREAAGLGESDAFPVGDIGIARALAENGLRPSHKAVLARAEAWRPWRAYAVLHLWTHDAAQSATRTKEKLDALAS